MDPASIKLAYVSDGKLFVHDGGSDARPVDSPFVDGLLERAQRDRERNAWKQDSFGWSATGRMPMAGLARAVPQDAARRVRFTGVAGGPGELVYVLDTNVTAGLFSQTIADRSERRVFHKQGLRARDLSRRADGSLAMAIRNDDGSASIATMAPGGRGIRPLTEGDVVDEQPSWIGNTDAIIYQSAGIGRDREGMFVALGPYSIVRLDTRTGHVDTVLERQDFDLLAPRVVDGGLEGEVLYYIRRPYQPVPPVSPWKVLGDILAFPYRLCRAVLYFFNFLSILFVHKPIITSTAPDRISPDQRYMMFWGRMVDARKAMRDRRSDGALVPKDWTLIRRALATGQESEIARNVLAFDVTPNGAVIHTDGSHIYRTNLNGAREKLLSAKLIERVLVFPS